MRIIASQECSDCTSLPAICSRDRHSLRADGIASTYYNQDDRTQFTGPVSVQAANLHSFEQQLEAKVRWRRTSCTVQPARRVRAARAGRRPRRRRALLSGRGLVALRKTPARDARTRQLRPELRPLPLSDAVSRDPDELREPHEGPVL